jgi:4-carboxymuconolactone decarboxylase
VSEPTPIAVPAGLRGLAGFAPESITALRTMRESLERLSGLDERTIELIRIGCLVALGAPGDALRAHVERFIAGGGTADDVWGTVLAIAPLVGVPRLVAAGGQLDAVLAGD